MVWSRCGGAVVAGVAYSAEVICFILSINLLSEVGFCIGLEDLGRLSVLWKDRYLSIVCVEIS